jgi:hypothetical protein
MAADKLWDKPSVAFDEWWNGDNDESTNPFRLESGAYWAWAGWKAALAQPPLPVQKDSCFCHSGVSLQSVSGGAAPEGYLGRVTLLIDGEYVAYVKAHPPLPVQEPLAWMCSAFDGEPCEQTNHDECGNPIPLYTTPPQPVQPAPGYCKNCKDYTIEEPLYAQPAQEPTALQGLSAYLRCEAGGEFVGSPNHETLMQWAREVDAARAQPAQEPVAHVYLFDHDGRPLIAWDNAKGIKIGDKLYTTPPQREWVGLDHDELIERANQEECASVFSRGAIWGAAKLKEKNNGT